MLWLYVSFASVIHIHRHTPSGNLGPLAPHFFEGNTCFAQHLCFTSKIYTRSACFVTARGLTVLSCNPGRELLSATTETEISWFYPGRPFTTTDEVCTSRGDTCFGFVVGPNRFIECPPRSPAPYESVDEKCRTSEKTWLGTILTPRHVREDGLCEAARQKV